MASLTELISDGLGRDGLVWLKLPPAMASAGRSLEWCKNKIAHVLDEGPQVFKIGITANPLHRFYRKPNVDELNPSPGYYFSREKFKCMHVVFCGSTWDEVALMEAILIQLYKDTPGNRNVRPGGEGRKMAEGPYFTYIVFKPAIPR